MPAYPIQPGLLKMSAKRSHRLIDNGHILVELLSVYYAVKRERQGLADDEEIGGRIYIIKDAAIEGAA